MRAHRGHSLPHSSTSYDYGLNGLHAAWYDNPSLAGAPTTFSLGLPGVTDGSVVNDWGTGAPIAGITDTDNWSARFTGRIIFPTTGTYSFQTYADDGTQVWIDDILVVSDWAGSGLHYSPQFRTIDAEANESKSIRIAYREGTGSARLELHWTPPGGTRVTVPGSQLVPDYGLPNRTVVVDSVPAGSGLSDSQVPDLVTQLAYTHPWLGAVTSSTVDPDGLALTTSTAYEAPGTGWLRRETRTMPSGAPSTTTSAYWGDDEALTTAVCDLPAGTRQYGFLKSTTLPTPAVGGAVVTEFVYDEFGRTVGTKRTGDSDWSCVEFDDRGRVVETTFAAFDSTPARTVTTVHAVGGNPLRSSVTDPAGTISAEVDLVGRTVSTTDVWGLETRPTYNAAGRVSEVTISPLVGADVVQAFTYDLDGKVLTVRVNGELIAEPDYDAVTQLLQSVAYSNGSSLASITRNANTGSGDGIEWAFPARTTEHPATGIYAATFESGADAWAAVGSDAVATVSTTAPRTDLSALDTSTTSVTGGAVSAVRTVDELTVGRDYTLTAWVNGDASTGVSDVTVGVAGIGTSTPATLLAGYSELTYTFTATATSHELTLQYDAADDVGSTLHWDDVSLVQDAWVQTLAEASTVAEQVVRSQSGRIVANSLTSGTHGYAAQYTFDAASRMTQAILSVNGTVDHVLDYGFDTPGSACVGFAGAVSNAGVNGNRTTFSDAHTTGGVTSTSSTTYCYDAADRLLGSIVSGDAVPEANPVADGLTAGELAYDAHGNTVTFADQVLVFDVANRHVSTTITAAEGTTTITYLRDAANRIVERMVDAPGTENDITTRYAHTGSADVSGVVVDALGAISEYTVSVPGGAAVRFVLGSEPREQWTYPNMLGSVIVEADGDGIRNGGVVRYDPWGQPIDPVTGRIGTTIADDAVIDNAPGDADYAFVGGHRKLYEHQGSVAIVQMGARVYVPALGRFLSVDPVEGGVDNDYVYPTDPVNKLDLTGLFSVDTYLRLTGNLGMLADKNLALWKSGQPRPPTLLELLIRGPRKPSTSTSTSTYSGAVGQPPLITIEEMPGGPNLRTGLSGNVEFCAMACGSVGLGFASGKAYLLIGYGVGPALGFTGNVGHAWGTGPGVSTYGQCAGAFGPVGAYAQAGFAGPGDYNAELGWTSGLRAGCSLNQVHTLQIGG